MANLATGPFVAACVLLLVSGFGKVRNPGATEPALRAIGLPARPNAVRLLGVAELTVAIAGLCIGPAALVVAALYGALAIVAWRLYRSSPATPCGCLGATAAPVSVAHVVLNLVATVVALCSVSATSPLARLAEEPAAGIVLLTLSLLTARLAVLTADLSRDGHQEASL
ncbi:MAG TPA: MauE/DoxX family redox-associated membrane protein [Acidimicrobiia bacterium]|nr:MauE/DoxX family redox-associated membrane protein [Acidimicrobiia bacterium]